MISSQQLVWVDVGEHVENRLQMPAAELDVELVGKGL